MCRITTIACSTIVILAGFASEAHADQPVDELLSTYVGTWQAAGSAGGKDFTGTLVFKWGHSKSCVVSEYTVNPGGEQLFANHMIGFDTKAKCYRALGFWSDGSMEDYHYTKGTDGVYRGVFAGSQDGQRLEGALTVAVSKDSFRVETKGLTLGGDPIPELTVTFTRVNE